MPDIKVTIEMIYPANEYEASWLAMTAPDLEAEIIPWLVKSLVSRAKLNSLKVVKVEEVPE